MEAPSVPQMMVLYGASGNSNKRRDIRRRYRKRSLEADLHAFAKTAWHVIEPSNPFVDGWHIRNLCDHLVAVTKRDLRNLIVTQPPRTSKSSFIATLWPVWEWTKFPGRRWLFASYSAMLSARDSKKRREIIKSPFFRELWWGAHHRLKEDDDTQTRFANGAQGWMFATSVGGAATGEGGDTIVGDDLLKADARFSQAERRHCIDWWDTVMSSRVNDPKTACRVIVGQRICEDDLIGHLLAGGQYSHLCYPMHWREGHKYAKGPFPNGGYDPRSKGETGTTLLWPERFDEAAVVSYSPPGAYDRAAQIEQDPHPEEGDMFARKHFCYFAIEGGGNDMVLVLTQRDGTKRRVMARDCWWFQTADTALEPSKDAAYTAVGTFALTSAPVCLCVCDMIRDRLPVPEQYGFIVAQRTKHPFVTGTYVERKASGHGLIQEGAIRGTPFGILVADVSKEKRAVPVSIAYENGTVFHRAGAVWIDEFEEELIGFPGGRFADQVDCLAYSGLLAQQRMWQSASEGGLAAYAPDTQDKESGGIRGAETVNRIDALYEGLRRDGGTSLDMARRLVPGFLDGEED